MTLSEQAEEILEGLWIELVENNKESCDTALLRESEGLRELVRHACVHVDGRQVTLTPRGREEARQCVRRHRLAERLMVDLLQCRKPFVHETSCAFEHLLHRGLDENICILLGHPRTCPHGRPIPEGKCCREAHKQTGRLIMPLSEAKAGQRAVVVYLQTGNRDALQKLIAMGILPKTPVRVIQQKPTLVFEMGKSQFAIDHALASHIFVRPGDR
jgi:DtxR family Mn-dependent transcriptional regulator